MCRGGRALVSEFKGLDSITTYKSQYKSEEKISGLTPLSCLLSFYYENGRASAPLFTRTRISTKIAGLKPLSLHCYKDKGAKAPQKRGQSPQIFVKQAPSLRAKRQSPST